MKRWGLLISMLSASLLLPACRRDMADQAHHEPLEASRFFRDGAASRRPPAHTVAQGDARLDEFLYTGKTGGKLVNEFPEAVTRAMLQRGQERFDIYCSVCHGRLGDGHGMIVQRGFPTPPSFHDERLRTAPVGHFYEVITNGWGVMYSYAARVEPQDRWAIAAYIRALQLSQHAALADAAAPDRAKLEKGGEAP
jgi:mono/diheme cytochrome c family protein